MRIHETATPGLASTGRARTWRARIIEGDRWGSSGYYSREVLERDGPAAWPAGTRVFFDHPTLTEDAERPVRSVKDLAGKIVSTPVYEGDGLYADVEFYAHTAHVVEAMAADVGLSIRASAEVEAGEADGRQGWIITSLSDGVSVDVVTAAGAGGMLVHLLESVRAVAEALPEGMSYAGARDLLEKAIAGLGRWRYVIDFTETEVIYSVEPEEGPSAYYRQAYTLTADEATLTGARIEVRPRTVYEPVDGPTDVPADPAGQPQPATESERTHNMATIQIEEAQHAALVEKAGRVETLETQLTETTAERDTAQAALAEAHREADTARAEAIITAAEGYTFSDLEAKGLLADLPRIAESGRLDKEAFEKTVAEAAAKLAAEAGAGRPFGHGTTHTSGMTLAEFDKALADLKGI